MKMKVFGHLQYIYISLIKHRAPTDTVFREMLLLITNEE